MRKKRVTRAVLGLMVCLVASCGPANNACVGVGSEPDLDSCFQNENTSDSCDAFNSEGLNGDSWTFDDGKTCTDEGFDYECPSGTYKLSDDYCGT